MNFNLVTVKIADQKTAASPDILRTVLGSCIGICLYDPVKQIGGLAHIMLPSGDSDKSRREKYADSAIPFLLKRLEEMGAERRKIVAKIIGGATMFKVSVESIIGNIGNRNIEMVQKVLKEQKITIVAEDVGGDHARTIDFFLENGQVRIKSANKSIKMI